MDKLLQAQLEVIGKTYKTGVCRAGVDFVDRQYIESRKEEFLALGLDPNDPEIWQSDISETRREVASMKAFGHPYESLKNSQIQLEKQQMLVLLSIEDGRDYTNENI